MSSNKLSALLEKLIRRLCLTDFPCGFGSWREPKDGADADSLLDLLSCPHSPWCQDVSWSPEAPALGKLAMLSPESLHADFIYSYFTTLRIIDKHVSAIDCGLLKFSKLEELVLSANKILDVPGENLPGTLKILDLRANQLSTLCSLTICPPPHLLSLSLGSNPLGCYDDICNLNGTYWPQLVCLDLGDCEFLDQQALLSALSTLPCLKTLVLEGNPFTMTTSYPGLTVDSLPRLSYLDTFRISPEERHRYRGLSNMSMNVSRLRGIPYPVMSEDQNAPDFPVITHSYYITYKFLTHCTPINLKSDSDSEPRFDTGQTTKDVSCEMERSKADGGVGHAAADVSRHSTTKLIWSENMDFNHTQTYIISDLGAFKKFLNQGLYLTIEEEKVLSWRAASEEIPGAKPGRPVKDKKGGKGKESPIKSDSTKDKSKDKKKKSVPELVHDAPIRRRIGSARIPLQSLVRGGQTVDVLCDLGALHTQCEMEMMLLPEKDLGNKKTEESKRRGSSGPKQKGKGKGESEMDVHTVSTQKEPLTVQVRVELEKWRLASEARQLLLPSQAS